MHDNKVSVWTAHLPKPSPTPSEDRWCSVGESSLSSLPLFLFDYRTRLRPVMEDEEDMELLLYLIEKNLPKSMKFMSMYWPLWTSWWCETAKYRWSPSQLLTGSPFSPLRPSRLGPESSLWSSTHTNRFNDENTCFQEKKGDWLELNSTSSPRRPSIPSRSPWFCFCSQSLRRRKKGDRQRGETRLQEIKRITWWYAWF